MNVAFGPFQQILFKLPFIVATNGVNDATLLLKNLIVTHATNHFAIVVKFSLLGFGIPTYFLQVTTGCHWFKRKEPIVGVFVHALLGLRRFVMLRQAVFPTRYPLADSFKRILQQGSRRLLLHSWLAFFIIQRVCHLFLLLLLLLLLKVLLVARDGFCCCCCC